MKIAFFSTKSYDRQSFEEANEKLESPHDLEFFEARLRNGTVGLAQGFPAVCAFVNDVIDAEVIGKIAESGTKLIALRCAGFNNVDLKAAAEHNITVARVPAYSPYAVAEHAVAMILTLNRKTHRAYNRVREGNFSLEGLTGFDLHGRTVGVIGTGRIGRIFAGLMKGFGCKILAYDPYPHDDIPAMGGEYIEFNPLIEQADIVSLHCPLTPGSFHLIDDEQFQEMKPGSMLINTSRGALINASSAIRALKSGQLGYLGLDVYEEEGDLFFKNLSEKVIQDDIFARLLTFPNVLITGHQAFFTREALGNIADTTLQNLTAFETGEGELHQVGAEHHA
jgi:D-lactate dehydrogenase